MPADNVDHAAQAMLNDWKADMEAICSAARFNTCSLDMVHFLQIEGMFLIPVRQHRPYFFHSNFKQNAWRAE